MSQFPIPLSSAPLLQGRFFCGVDLGQKRDHSVIAIVKKQDESVYLCFLKRFKLGTEYASVMGALKRLNERLDTLHRILIDQTGVGEVFVEEAIKSGLKNASGIMLSLPSKEDVLGYLKQRMELALVHIYFDQDLINEINTERYELTKTGQVQFSHPEGTHDDRLWAFALAVYCSRPEVPKFVPFAAHGKAIKPRWQVPQQNWSTLLPRS